MPLEVVFHPDAIDEASHARRWYAARSPRAATAFMAELDRAVAGLAEAPLRWPPGHAGTRRALLRRFPYGLVYRLGLDQVQVLAVAHLHRKPGYWRERT